MNSKRVIGAVLVAAAALPAAGCAAENGQQATAPASERKSTGTGQPAGRAEFNSADVKFVRGMIPHHRQAVRMAEMVLERPTGEQLRKLAEQIREAQNSEIGTMRGWLRSWGVQQGQSAQHSGGTNHSSGMMSKADMAALADASGEKFRRMWLRMMIEHHRGAVEMARHELENGRNDAAQALARRIIEAQQAEIDKMKSMLQA